MIWEEEAVNELRGLCLNVDETMIAAVSSDNKHCLVYNRVDGTLIAKIATESSMLTAVCFAGSSLLCGGDEGAVNVIDVSKESVVRQLTGPTGFVCSIDYCPSLDMVAAGSFDGSIHIWRLSTGEPFTRLTGHTSYVLSVLFHPVNSDILISGSWDYSIRMWNVSDSTCLCCVDGAHTAYIRNLTISSDGSVLLSASEDKPIKKWSIE